MQANAKCAKCCSILSVFRNGDVAEDGHYVSRFKVSVEFVHTPHTLPRAVALKWLALCGSHLYLSRV